MSIPLAPSPPDPHASGRTGSSARSIHIASLSRFCIPALMQCSLQLSLSAADPHASGRSPSTVRSARTATLPAITTAAIAVSVPFSPSIIRPSCFGSDNRLRSLHKHRIALLAFIPQIWCMSHSCFVSTITWFAPFTPDTLSVFIPRSLSRYARSCFAQQLFRSLNSHSTAVQWQMLRSVRQVKFAVAKS